MAAVGKVNRAVALMCAVTVTGCGGTGFQYGGLSAAMIPKAPPLPKPAGKVVRIENIGQIYRAVKDAEPGTTILIPEGIHYLPRLLRVQGDGITIRGESGDRDKVILDGSRSNKAELIWLEGGDEGIEIVRTKDCRVYNNTVFAPDMEYRYPIHAFQATEGLEVVNNLVRGAGVVADAEDVRLEGNVHGELEGYFADPERGDLHLTDRATRAIDAGVRVPGIVEDIDRQKRSGVPDVGADERVE